MNIYQVTFRRLEAFYETIIVEALNSDEARDKACALSEEGAIKYDFREESDVIEEYIFDIEKID